jgi:hypothetical protein
MFGLGLSLWTNIAATGGGAAPPAATWTTTTGTSKHANVALSNGNLTDDPSGASGNFEGVRATRAATGSFSFTATIQSSFTPPNNCYVGIDDGTTDLSVSGAIPGSANSLGVVMQIFNGNWYISRNSGNTQGPIGSPTPAISQVILVTCDKAAGTVAFSVNGTAIGVAETGVAFTNWFAVTGSKGHDGAMTANFASY